MISRPKSLKDNKFPPFIRNSPFSSLKLEGKVFESLGIKDSSLKISKVLSGEEINTLRRSLGVVIRPRAFVDDIENCKLNFSSKIWDIATMSERGVRSCQSWNAGVHKTKLVGSMVDPTVGILWLSYRRTAKGSDMRLRSLVRAVLDKHDNICLFIDRMYVGYTHDHNFGAPHILGLHLTFKKFLESISGNKFEVKTYSDSNLNVSQLKIPKSPNVVKLTPEYRSYIDSGLQYTSNIRVKV